MNLNQFHSRLMMSTVPMPRTDFDAAAGEEMMTDCYYWSLIYPNDDPSGERVTMAQTDLIDRLPIPLLPLTMSCDSFHQVSEQENQDDQAIHDLRKEGTQTARGFGDRKVTFEKRGSQLVTGDRTWQGSLAFS